MRQKNVSSLLKKRDLYTKKTKEHCLKTIHVLQNRLDILGMTKTR